MKNYTFEKIIKLKDYYLILGLFEILASILFIYLKRLLKNSGFLNYWILGFFISGCAYILYIFYNNNTQSIELFAFSILFNVFPTIGNLLFVYGTWKYENKKINSLPLIIIPTSLVVIISIFTFVFPNSQMRMILNGIICSLAYLYIAYVFRNKNTSLFYRNRIPYLIVAVAHFSRVFHAIFINKENFISNTVQSKFILIFACLHTMFIIFNIILVLMTDINRILENQIKTKDKLYQVISHDIKGQLNNLINYNFVLKTSYKSWDDTKLKNWMIEMEKIATSSYLLMENMLFWSTENKHKIQLNIKSYNLSEIVTRCVAFFDSQTKFKEQRIILDLKDEVVVNCDLNLIETIIRNLIDNAVKNSKNQDDIFIKIYEANDSIFFEIKNEICYKIEDNIKNIQQIIDGTSPEFIGHGLLICKEFINKHKGELTFKNDNSKVNISFSIPKLFNI